MKLQELVAGAGVQGPLVNPEVQISSVVYDSRQATAGSLFVAIHAEKTDGNRFIAAAVERGAAAIVSEMPPQIPNGHGQTTESAPGPILSPVAWLQVPETPKTLT